MMSTSKHYYIVILDVLSIVSDSLSSNGAIIMLILLRTLLSRDLSIVSDRYTIA